MHIITETGHGKLRQAWQDLFMFTDGAQLRRVHEVCVYVSLCGSGGGGGGGGGSGGGGGGGGGSGGIVLCTDVT